MAQVIQFEERAVASLRQRLGAAESANQDLIAFARGHFGAVSALHGAVLAAIEADSLDAVLVTVTRDWPAMLGLDAVALALVAGGRGFRADASGIESIEPALIERAMESADPVSMESVGHGHPLLGAGAAAVRSQALIQISADAPLPHGLLLLGQHARQSIDTRHGALLLEFLGASLGAIIRRWTLSG